MAVIRIERVPVGVAGLGLLGFDHLELVYQSDDFNSASVQDTWYVIEGLRVSGIGASPVVGVEGIDGRTTLSQANGDRTGTALVAAIGTPATRGSRILDFADPINTWTLFASFGREFALQNFPYYAVSLNSSPLPTVNSNSVIASLLYYAGVDIATVWPRGVRFVPGWTTLLGTRASEELKAELSFDTILAGDGNDTITGSSDGRVDKLYGGLGDDTFKWSSGFNYIHGGQPQLAYAQDGLDTVDYSGAGRVVLTGNPDFVPDKTPNFIAKFAAGTDYLFSIERLTWYIESDDIVISSGATLLDQGLILDLGQQSGAGRGDTADFSERSDGLLIRATATADEIIVTDIGASDEKGLWLESPEWIVGSSGNDQIYATSDLRGIQAGAGNDLIDARAVTPFADDSPNGYDIEIDGGAGDDTIVSNAGHTFARGGAGADTFVLSSLTTSTDGKVVLTIDDADPTDRLYVAYSLFDGSGSDLAGSQLLPLLGGLGTYDEIVKYGIPSTFEWRLENTLFNSNDRTTGVIRFLGDISYTVSGSDLVVTLQSAHAEITDTPDNPLTLETLDPETIAEIVIKNYRPGDLGLKFYELGVSSDLFPPDGTSVQLDDYDTSVLALTNNGVLGDPLPEQPTGPSVRPDAERQQIAESSPVEGSDGSDVISLSAASVVDAGAGDDSVTGSSGDDILRGGSGNDTLSGGAGSDTYYVDQPGDVVVEIPREGRDTVVASADYVLGANIENLTLTGDAQRGVGNALGNTLIGDEAANTLSGLDGADFLAGNAGNDTLDGGTGSDTYAYAIGDGSDTIVDAGPAGETDTLTLSGIDPARVNVYRLAGSPNDLVLGFADGGSVTIRNFFLGNGTGIERVTFDSAPDWTRADLDRLAAAAPLVQTPPPTAVDDPYLAAAQSALTIAASALTANDVSPGSSSLSIVAVNAVSGGSVTLRPDGDIDATGIAGGNLVFTYTVSDGHGGQSTATATVAFIRNSAPVVTASISDVAASVGSGLSYTLPSTLFFDADGDALSLTATLADGSALPAWLRFDAATGTFAGTPTAGAAGPLQIVVTASDGLATTATGLRIVVAGTQNTPPVAKPESFSVNAGTSLVLSAGSLLANDTDAEGDPLQIGSVSSVGGNGSVVLQVDGSILYTPNAGFVGTDSFSYSIGDGHGGAATAIDTVVVRPVPGLRLTGTSGADTLIGGAGDDTITGDTGNDLLIGGAGNDLFLVAGSDGNDSYDGGLGLDTLRGSAGNDTIGILALTSIEVIDGGAGSDTIRGTSAGDFLDFSAVTLLGIEQINGAGGNDTIIGSAGSDTILGGTGDDSLAGGAGDDVFLLGGSDGYDVFSGGPGFDRIIGTTGSDVLGLANGSASLAGIESIELGDGIDTIRDSAGDDLIDLSTILLASVELIDGSGGNDTIIGSAGDDILKGGAGNDVFVFRPGGGHDTVTDYKLGTGTAPITDILDVSAFHFASFNALSANFALSSSGTDTIITLDANTSLTLSGVTPGKLKVNDFIL